MNIFGAFTFGSLIKTFIPGFVWLVALWLLWRGAAALIPVLPPLPTLPESEYQNALVALPLAILLGLLSNIVVFMGVNDALVRGPVKRRATDLFALQDWVIRRVRDKYSARLGAMEQAVASAFYQHADAEWLILDRIGVKHLAYVREQYWYHMEFQVNLFLAVATALVGLLAGLAPDMWGPAPRPAAEWIVTATVVLGGLCWFLLRAARKNFHRHVAKMTSLMVAAVCEETEDSVRTPVAKDT
jgi:hypothetical protein